MMYDFYGRCPIQRSRAGLQASDALLLPVENKGGRPAPAAAALSHADLRKRAVAAAEKMGLSPNDKLCVTAPSTLNAALGVIAAAEAQCPLVLPTSDVDDAAAAAAVEVEGASKVVASLA
jgi:hypothetical protein